MLYTAIPGRRVISVLFKSTFCSPVVDWCDVWGLNKLTELHEVPAEVEGAFSSCSLTASLLLLLVSCFALWCIEALFFPLVSWSLSKSSSGGPVHFVLLSRTFSLLTAAAPAAWDGVREALELAVWDGVMETVLDPRPILLQSGTISGSLSSLESLSPRVIGSMADPFSLKVLSWEREELNGDVFGAVLGAGVSGIEVDFNPACTMHVHIKTLNQRGRRRGGAGGAAAPPLFKKGGGA